MIGIIKYIVGAVVTLLAVMAIGTVTDDKRIKEPYTSIMIIVILVIVFIIGKFFR